MRSYLAIVLAVTGLSFGSTAVFAEDPDPLALPCTIGTTTQAVNPYSHKLETYKCEQCGSETCWIVQSDQ